MIVRNRWEELPMPTAVIDRVNVLGRTKRSLLVFTDRQGRIIVIMHLRQLSKLTLKRMSLLLQICLRLSRQPLM